MSRLENVLTKNGWSYYKKSYIVYYFPKDITQKELRYIYKEIEEERNTIGYTPIVRRYEDDLTVDLVYSHDDVATYRVIEIGHNYFQKGE